jgi:hypothetical protein
MLCMGDRNYKDPLLYPQRTDDWIKSLGDVQDRHLDTMLLTLAALWDTNRRKDQRDAANR